MPIREFGEIKLAVLNSVADEREYKFETIIHAVADHFALTPEERQLRVPSGNMVIRNDCVRATKELMEAGLLERPRRGYYKITPNGREFLNQNPAPSAEPDPADDGVSSPSRESETIDDPNCPTPEECIEECYQQHRAELAAELLEKIKNNSDRFFERFVLDLLIQMGYGGSREDAARAVGGSGDRGIDGIINQDRLGFDVIYIQAKRWQDNVQRRQIQEFAGALEGQRERKGIVITTSDFSRGAREYVNTINSKIVLINGRQLAELMIDHNVGVSTVKTYEIKRVDSDYFIETDNS